VLHLDPTPPPWGPNPFGCAQVADMRRLDPCVCATAAFAGVLDKGSLDALM